MTTIVLDPGHGGSQKVGGSSPNNATGPNGLKEKQATLSVALAAERALAGPGRTVVLTRRDDRNLGIADRAGVAKAARAEVFVSIHFNASNAAPAQGTETWIGVEHSADSVRLARAVQAHVAAATGYRDRGVKAGGVSGVIKASNHDPATANCLVEVSFLSDQPEEEARLRTQAYIDKLGKAVADAVIGYLGVEGVFPEAEDAASARRMGLLADEEALILPDGQDGGPLGSEPALEAAGTPAVNFGPNARQADVSAYSLGVLRDVMRRAGLQSVTISSTSRGPADQARVMYDNLEAVGVDRQKQLYGPAGDRVIDVYQAAKAEGLGAAAIKARMEAEIVRLGPSHVSRHAADPKVLNVFDVAPNSVANRKDFERALLEETRISQTFFPPNDPGYHIEIPQPATA